MSFLSLADIPLTHAEIHQPRYGSWRADVRTNNDKILSGSVVLAVGDLSLSGVIADGGVSAGVGRWDVRGSIAWDTIVPARAYQTDSKPGVRLRTVLTDLALDSGAGVASVVLPADARVGASYLRARLPARLLLAQLRAAGACPPWHVATDGRTTFAERAGAPIVATARVKDRNLALGLRWVAVDTYAPWIPGATFEGTTLDYVVIRASSRDTLLELRSI